MDSNIDLANKIVSLLKQDLSVKKENIHYLSGLGGNASQLFYLLTSNVVVEFCEEPSASFSKTESGDLLLSLPSSVMELSNLIIDFNWSGTFCPVKVSSFFKELRGALDLYLSPLNIRTLTEKELLDVNFLSEFKRHEDIEDLIQCCNICNEIIKSLSPIEDNVDSLWSECLKKKYDELHYNSLISKYLPKDYADTFKLLSQNKRYNVSLSVRVIIGIEKILKFNLDQILDSWNM